MWFSSWAFDYEREYIYAFYLTCVLVCTQTHSKQVWESILGRVFAIGAEGKTELHVNSCYCEKQITQSFVFNELYVIFLTDPKLSRILSALLSHWKAL